LYCTGFGNFFKSRFDEAIHNKGLSITLILCSNSHIDKQDARLARGKRAGGRLQMGRPRKSTDMEGK
jgi:hypothetical protein